MYRKFSKVLEKWDQHHEKPLMIIGARQVGKTWLIQDFCREHYHDYLYLNFEETPEINTIFDGSLKPEDLLRKMSIFLGQRIDSSMALVFDEIQKCERAITSLKYFCESEKDYRVIAAGSLLGVKLQRFESSFPVGKVSLEKMQPMDFEEFLLACGDELLRDAIFEAFEKKEFLIEGIHNKALRLYHDYLFIGGMPEVVQEYIEAERNIYSMQEGVLKNLQLAYLADMTKYTLSAAEGAKIVEVYQSIPRQLAKENPKFKYTDIRPYANRRDFSGALEWLESSGMIYRINRVEMPEHPLKGYEENSNFKIYLSDVGILTNACGLHYKDLLPDQPNMYKGAVIENYVVQQLFAQDIKLYYYKPSEKMEIDLIFEDKDGNIIPAEIKSGRRKRSTSLNNYMDKYNAEYAIRFSELNFGYTNNIFSVPLYATWCIKPVRSI